MVVAADQTDRHQLRKSLEVGRRLQEYQLALQQGAEME